MKQPIGIILCDKPRGMRSNTLVKRTKRIVKTKVGHAGTLDSAAEGLMILLIGHACSFSDFFLKKDKSYHVEIEFGKFTDTHDSEGTVLEERSFDESVLFLRSQGEAAKKLLNSFVGRQNQVPPVFSAVKSSGSRLSDLARSGRQQLAEAKQIEIYSVSNVVIEENRLSFRTNVSSGTYIRSIVRDLSQILGFPAVMSKLRRTSIDRYSIEDHRIFAPHLDSEWGKLEIPAIVSLDECLPFPAMEISDAHATELSFGRVIPIDIKPREQALLRNREGTLLAWIEGTEKGYVCKRTFVVPDDLK